MFQELNFIISFKTILEIMKKLFFGAAAFMVVAAMASCTKTQTKTADPGTASVVLHMGINTDLTNDTTYNGSYQMQYENLPSGTVVQFVGNTRDLQENPIAGYSYKDVVYTGTVDANGDVAIEIPAIANPANIEVKFPELELDKKTERYNTVTGSNEVITTKQIYTRQDANISVWNGAKIVREYNY